MTSALVTGSAGYIGKNLYDYLFELDWDVEGVDVRENYSQALLHKDIYHNLDLVEDWMSDKDIIFHLAALTPKNAERFKAQWWKYNVGMTYCLMDLLKPHQVLIHTSTLGVKRKWDHPYAETKKVAEAATTLFNKPIAIARLANVWGRNGNGVIDRWIQLALKNKIIEIHTGQKRDFIHVLDVCSAFHWIAIYMKQSSIIQMSKYYKSPWIFEVGSGNPIDVGSLAIPIRSYCKSNSKFTWVNKEPSSAMANNLTLKNIGWEPEYQITKALKEEIEWYQNR